MVRRYSMAIEFFALLILRRPYSSCIGVAEKSIMQLRSGEYATRLMLSEFHLAKIWESTEIQPGHGPGTEGCCVAVPRFPAPAIRVPGTKAQKGCFLFPKSPREIIDMRHKTQSHADWRKRFKRHAFVSTLCVQLRSLWNPSLSSDLHRISKKKYYSDLHSNSQSEHYSVNSTAGYIQDVIFTLSPN